jgi:hypothetical protein
MQSISVQSGCSTVRRDRLASPGSDKPLEKHTFCTKVAGQDCGVGFYKE